MSHTLIGPGNDAGLSRKAHGVDVEKLLLAAAEALHERVGTSKGWSGAWMSYRSLSCGGV